MPLPAYLSKLSDVVKNIVVKKTVYGKLVAKANSIDISGFVLKKGMTQINQIQKKKIPDKSGLVKNLDCNTKITEIENKIPNVSSLKKQKNYSN